MEKDDFVEFWFENGVLHSKFTREVHLDVEVGKILIDKRHQASNFEKQYWCYDFRNVKSMSKASREHAAEKGQEFLYACAVIVDSYITRFIVNTFSLIKKPKVPFKAFPDKASALLWLNEFKK